MGRARDPKLLEIVKGYGKTWNAVRNRRAATISYGNLQRHIGNERLLLSVHLFIQKHVLHPPISAHHHYHRMPLHSR
jgi:hypothetical protein